MWICAGCSSQAGKKMRRCSVAEAEIETKSPSGRLDEKDILSSLSISPLGEKESTQMSGLEGQWYQAEVNFQVLWRRLKSKIESTDISPTYAKYLDVGRTPEPCLALEDVCLIYDPSTSRERECRNMKQVVKKSTNNIYTYIGSALLREISACENRRLSEFISKTFYGNEYAMRCTFDGLAMAILGEHVGRACWAIGSGGVGQSLLTTRIHNAINPMRGYVDRDALRRDGELRKTISRISGHCVLTTTDETGGCEENFRNIRRRLYKKIRHGGKMMCRPPYARTEKAMSTSGLMRFQTSRPPSFGNAREEHWGSIYIRSLVIKTKGKFIHVEEYEALPAEQKGIWGGIF